MAEITEITNMKGCGPIVPLQAHFSRLDVVRDAMLRAVHCFMVNAPFDIEEGDRDCDFRYDDGGFYILERSGDVKIEKIRVSLVLNENGTYLYVDYPHDNEDAEIFGNTCVYGGASCCNFGGFGVICLKPNEEFPSSAKLSHNGVRCRTTYKRRLILDKDPVNDANTPEIIEEIKRMLGEHLSPAF